MFDKLAKVPIERVDIYLFLNSTEFDFVNSLVDLLLLFNFFVAFSSYFILNYDCCITNGSFMS